MSKVLAKCREILATKRANDNADIERLVSAIARQLGVSVTEEQMERAVVYLRHGCVVW